MTALDTASATSASHSRWIVSMAALISARVKMIPPYDAGAAPTAHRSSKRNIARQSADMGLLLA